MSVRISGLKKVITLGIRFSYHWRRMARRLDPWRSWRPTAPRFTNEGASCPAFQLFEAR